MQPSNVTKFPPGVAEKLRYYVYRLIDPRNGETFYIGKGKDDRVFAHCRGAVGIGADAFSDKIQRILDVRNSGFEVAHVIHRHGMDEETAWHVECALIDSYPGLLNEVAGRRSNELGPRHSKQIIELYGAEPAVLDGLKVLFISINQSITKSDIYEAVRFAWKIDIRKAQKAEVILATQQGMIRGVFVAEAWLPATSKNFPGKPSIPDRYGFVGHQAGPVQQQRFLNKRMPDEFRKKGASNPVKYGWR